MHKKMAPFGLSENSKKRSNRMRSRLKNGIVSTRGNEGACPLVHSRTGSWYVAKKKSKKESIIELFFYLFYNLNKMKAGQTFKRNFLFLFFIFILLFKAGIGLQSKSPVYHVEYLTIDDGLSQGSVNCILQDSTGFLWFGTQDGLNRYDGYEFIIFKNLPFDSNSLSYNWIQTMIESEPGVLWLGTRSKGLNRFDTLNQRFTRFRHTPGDETGLSSNRIQALYRDSGGVLWIGTMGGGLNRLDPDANRGTFTHYKNIPGSPSSLSHNEVNAIYEDFSGSLWIGTNKGLNRFDHQTGQFTRFFHDANDPGSLSGDAITVITGDSKGNLWIGTLNDGLNRYILSENRFERFRHHARDPNSLCSNTVSRVNLK
jgi:ligand-binding sensor domain-containing protein